MKRLKMYLDGKWFLGADIEEGADVGEAIVMLGESMIRLSKGELEPMKFNDSKKIVDPLIEG